MNSWQYRYDTGWINRDDWANVHLGSNTTKNTDSNVTHNLNAPLSNLLVKLFVSTDGTDATSFEVMLGTDNDGANNYGIISGEVDNNNIILQTGSAGFLSLNTAGTTITVDTEDWYYKVKIWYIG